MHLQDMTFIGLDLETTGLSPEKDTIIEIAAVRFHLERDGDTFRAVYDDERSMLINPGRPLDETISMITHITDDMLVGKPRWNDVKDRVGEFIGDAIIVGHNVLFDTSMLRSHGIDLTKNITLDTFELSEILSQDAESLNLAFLAEKYHIDIASEHRALDDTKLSVGLFIHFIHEIVKMHDRDISLWSTMSRKDHTQTLSTLLSIVSRESDETWSPRLPEMREEILTETSRTNQDIIHHMDEEDISDHSKEFITSLREKHEKLLIITPGKKEALYLEKKLREKGEKASLYRGPESYIDISIYNEWMERTDLSRKEIIFLLKLSTWLDYTETGLLDEMKYYGDEQNYLPFFRDEKRENVFFLREEAKRSTRDITIAPYSSLDKTPITTTGGILIRDIGELEDAIRRKTSIYISSENILRDTETLSHLIGTSTDDIILGISMIRDMWSSVKERPEGDAPFPPGDYGETYFITQKDLWHRGYRWLPFARVHLERAHSEITRIKSTKPTEKKILKNLRDRLKQIVSLSLYPDDNLGIIVNITETDTSLTLIPRNIRSHFTDFEDNLGVSDIYLRGYGIGTPMVSRFLSRELGVDSLIEGPRGKKIMTLRENIKPNGKTVILTTSSKHIRALKGTLAKEYNNKAIFAQGLSGGKGKILSLFSKREDAILIGLIDTWKDERELWKITDTLIIAKVPFDPPTDPYFLARTVGMKNNFEEYSMPIATITMNTIIGKAYNSNPDISIISCDERLLSTNWGKSLYSELL